MEGNYQCILGFDGNVNFFKYEVSNNMVWLESGTQTNRNPCEIV